MLSIIKSMLYNRKWGILAKHYQTTKFSKWSFQSIGINANWYLENNINLVFYNLHGCNAIG
jgi:hypothetical protein